jgi:quercetin dioxygenase-like cupin family protein
MSGTPGAPFETYAGAAGEWAWRGDRLAGTRRAVAMLVEPARVGNREVMMALARIPAGQAAPWHVHAGFEEFVYVLEGAGELLVAGRPAVPVGPGSVNLIAPGSWHCHRTVGEADLVFLWGYAPPGEQLRI